MTDPLSVTVTQSLVHNDDESRQQQSHSMIRVIDKQCIYLGQSLPDESLCYNNNHKDQQTILAPYQAESINHSGRLHTGHEKQ